MNRIKSIGAFIFFIPIFNQFKNLSFENLSQNEIGLVVLFLIGFFSIVFNIFDIIGILLVAFSYFAYKNENFFIDDFYLIGFLLVLFSNYFIKNKKPSNSKIVPVASKSVSRHSKTVSTPTAVPSSSKPTSTPSAVSRPSKPISTPSAVSRPSKPIDIDPWKKYKLRNYKKRKILGFKL